MFQEILTRRFFLTSCSYALLFNRLTKYHAYNPAYAPYPGCACWQGPSPSAGVGTPTGDGFAQQSWTDKIGTSQLSIESEAILSAPEHLNVSFDSSLIQPEPDVELSADSGLAQLLLLPDLVKPVGAIVMKLPEGGFFCSQLGCDTIYLRVGDCRRHLKKHNGPFFVCTQHDCSMEFYRHDKLRAHMMQGHNIAVAAPRRGRRSAQPSMCKPTGIVKLVSNRGTRGKGFL